LPGFELESRTALGQHFSTKLRPQEPSDVSGMSSGDVIEAHLVPFTVAKNLKIVSPVDESPNFKEIVVQDSTTKVNTHIALVLACFCFVWLHLKWHTI
jgi:hypothetical protein